MSNKANVSLPAQSQPSQNTSKALSLVLNVLQLIPQVGAAASIAVSLVTDIKAAIDGTGDVSADQLAALEQQTNDLMGQIDDDVKGLGTAGQL